MATAHTQSRVRRASAYGNIQWFVFPLAAALIYWQALHAISFFASRGGGALIPVLTTAAIVIPLTGLAIVSRSPFAGYLTVVLPPLTVASAVLTGVAAKGGYWTLLAGAVPITVFGGGLAIGGLSPRLLLRLHRSTAVALLIFVLAHLFNHLVALNSIDAHKAVQQSLRLVYRNGIVEPILIAAIMAQAILGVALVWRGRRFRKGFLNHCQAASGLMMAVFLCSHVMAVVVSGRALRNVDTDFVFAASGPAGLLHSPGSAMLIPYYFLAPVAFFFHIAWALRHSLQPKFSLAFANRTAAGVFAAGALISTAILLALCGVRAAWT